MRFCSRFLLVQGVEGFQIGFLLLCISGHGSVLVEKRKLFELTRKEKKSFLRNIIFSMVSVICVNYKTADYLARMLASLFAFHQQPLEIFVVENASGDDLEPLRKKYPQVVFLSSDRNLGFAGGCNQGITKANGDYFLLVNPDIEFHTDAITQMEKMMDLNPEVGIGGISLKNYDGTQQMCVWSFPELIDQLMVLCKLPHVFPQIKSVSQWLMKDFDYSKDADVDQVMGAFFCIRREVVEQIGLLDEGFFMWYEEVDFCKRAKNAGWTVHYFSQINALHKKGSSFDRLTTFRKQNMLRKSLRRYFKKHNGWFAWMFLLIGEPFFFCVA